VDPRVLRGKELALEVDLRSRSEANSAPSEAKNYNVPAMISKDLLDMLVCPECKKPVALNPDGQSLKCPLCRRVYPIQDDIPIMLLDVATIDAV
jgi:uncharacterized protein YbaR (Trm112 family)